MLRRLSALWYDRKARIQWETIEYLRRDRYDVFYQRGWHLYEILRKREARSEDVFVIAGEPDLEPSRFFHKTQLMGLKCECGVLREDLIRYGKLEAGRFPCPQRIADYAKEQR